MISHAFSSACVRALAIASGAASTRCCYLVMPMPPFVLAAITPMLIGLRSLSISPSKGIYELVSLAAVATIADYVESRRASPAQSRKPLA